MAGFQFDPGGAGIEELQRLANDMWSDIAFDTTTLARLRRDGLALEGVRLTGPSPYILSAATDGMTNVVISDAVSDPQHVNVLIDLWQVHFIKGVRPGSIAA